MLFAKVLLHAGIATGAALRLSSDNIDPSIEKLVEQQNDKVEFQQLLNALPEQTLHKVLHNSLAEYKDGVFDHDKTLLEKVHDNDPPLATSLLSAAALEMLKSNLSKRQNNNSTGPTSSGNTPEPSSSTPPPPPPPPTSSSNPPPASSQQNNPPPSSGNSNPPPPPNPTSNPGGNSGGSPTSGSGGDPGVTPPPVEIPYTTTDANGNTFITSSRGVVSSIVIKTTTLPGGEVAVITTYEYATPSGDGTGADATRTGAAPGLQTGAAASIQKDLINRPAVILGCAAGLFWFF